MLCWILTVYTKTFCFCGWERVSQKCEQKKNMKIKERRFLVNHIVHKFEIKWGNGRTMHGIPSWINIYTQKKCKKFCFHSLVIFCHIHFGLNCNWHEYAMWHCIHMHSTHHNKMLWSAIFFCSENLHFKHLIRTKYPDKQM